MAKIIRPYNPKLADAGIRPEEVCVCGHEASEHDERLPAPCWHGVPDEARHPEAITAKVLEQLSGGCHCISFSLRKPEPPEKGGAE